MSASLPVTEATWSEEVLKSDKPVLVDFWADWCGPCRVVAPVLDELATEFAGQAKIVKLDVDQNPAIARQFQVLSIPTLLLLKDGQVVDSLIGAHPKADIIGLINKAL